jgi:hypothetical protein
MAALALPLVAVLAGSGCSMCQNCLDGTGPAPHAANYSSYHHSPRIGSASAAETAYDEPLPEGEILPEGALLPGEEYFY